MLRPIVVRYLNLEIRRFSQPLRPLELNKVPISDLLNKEFGMFNLLNGRLSYLDDLHLFESVLSGTKPL